jgi:hypothetical protein
LNYSFSLFGSGSACTNVSLNGLSKSLFGNSVAFDQMSTASWKLVCLGPEVGDLGDLVIVAEIKEAQAGLRAFLPGDLDPAGGVLTLADDPVHRDVRS